MTVGPGFRPNLLARLIGRPDTILVGTGITKRCCWHDKGQTTPCFRGKSCRRFKPAGVGNLLMGRGLVL